MDHVVQHRTWSIVEAFGSGWGNAVDGHDTAMLQALDDVTAGVFRAAARLRGARAFHPVGVAYPAAVEIEEDLAAPALRPGTLVAVVRFSRGAGLPRPLPDIHGVGLRVLDAHGPGRHQDVLVTSVVSPGVGRYVLRPGWTVSGPTYSSIAPYRGPSGDLLLGARVPPGERYDLNRLHDVVEAGRCRLELMAAHPFGPWRSIGTVTVHHDRLSEEDEEALQLDPWNTAEGFTPVGWVNRLRRPAYAASQEGRRSTRGRSPGESV